MVTAKELAVGIIMVTVALVAYEVGAYLGYWSLIPGLGR